MSKPPTTAGQTCEPDYLLIPDKKGVCKLGMKRQQGAVQLQTDHQEGRLQGVPKKMVNKDFLAKICTLEP